MSRLILLTALLVGLSAAPAHARDIEQHPFTNLSPASYVYADALLRAAAADVDEWWFRISGQRPPALDLYVYDADDEGTAYAEYYTGRVMVTREHRNHWWETSNDRSLPLKQRRAALVDAWALMAHERGHNLGLHHSGVECHSIMCPSSSVAPGRALDWARQMLPTPKRRQQRLTRRTPRR